MTIVETTWPQDIRRYVYQLISINLILGLFTIGYISWHVYTSHNLRKLTDDYHLTSDYHLTKALAEIRHVEYLLIRKIANKESSEPLQIESIEPKYADNITSAFHLIQQEISMVLKLHNQFTNHRFDALTKKLERKYLAFTESSQNHLTNRNYPRQIFTRLSELITPLEQLERLHSIEHDNTLAQLNVREKRQTLVFLILVSIILLVAALLTRRGMRAIIMITSQQVQIEEQIHMLSQAIEQSTVSVMITDTEANLIYVNKAFEKVSGYKSAEVLGKNPSLLQSGQTPRSTYNEIWHALTDGKTWDCELKNRRKNGEIFYESAHFAPVTNKWGDITHFLAIKEDITLRKEQETHIMHQAHYDALTNLPNRFLVLDRLTQLFNTAKRKNNKIAVLFLDLDDFKKVNDSLGHETGDQLLIEAAERLQSIVRSDDTVGRLGGDEFIILLPGLSDPADAIPIVDNVTNRFREAFKINNRELILTASIGIAVFPNDGDNTSELLRNADSAMYHAKELGRNTYSYFTEAMNLKVSRRLALEEQMHGALERGEFHILYQPQIDIINGRIIGTEALLRWNNPVLGQVLPDEFIPIAEQTGLIVSLGQFVLADSLNLTAQWQQHHGLSFQAAVNLSPRQFRDPNLVKFIETTLQKSKITAESLELEITEGVLMSGHAYIDEALNALSNLGVKFAMDDFGTGYSSMSYLRNYPFHTLKIDRSFVNDITVDPADAELVNATIAMAHGLGLKVVAEGVETNAQLAHLEAQGCEFAQGYLFSKPVSSENITKMLQSQNQAWSQLH